MEKKLSEEVIRSIMDKAIQINVSCGDECRDFRIMKSPMRKSLILRWTTINLDNIERPLQCYHYECFNEDGSSQNCSVNYSNQDEANKFFFSLQTLYKQLFASDHKVIK